MSSTGRARLPNHFHIKNKEQTRIYPTTLEVQEARRGKRGGVDEEGGEFITGGVGCAV